MKHKMIHYKGYFLLALVFISTAAFMGASELTNPLPFFAVGVVFWIIGCAKVALRNSSLKTDRNI